MASNQHSQNFKVGYLTDGALVAKTQHLLGRDTGAKATATVVGRLVPITSEEPVGELAQVLALESSVIQNVQVVLSLASNEGTAKLEWTREKSAIVLTLTYPPNQLQRSPVFARGLALFAEARRVFHALDTPEALKKAMSAELRVALERQDRVLAELEAVNLRMANGIAALTTTLRAEWEERKAALEADNKRHRAELEAEHGRKEAALAERETKLAARAQELDDRDARAARRGMRADLLEQIQTSSTKFELTKATQQKRGWIRAACLAGLIATGVLFGVTVGSSEPAMLLTRGAAALTFALLLIFYLRWEHAWAQRHADAEFHLKRLALDINRANWVIEAAMEWSHDQKQPMPDAIVAAVTHGLFVENEAPEVVHPTEQLAAELLRRSRSARFKLGDAELDIAGRDLRALDRERNPTEPRRPR